MSCGDNNSIKEQNISNFNNEDLDDLDDSDDTNLQHSNMYSVNDSKLIDQNTSFLMNDNLNNEGDSDVDQLLFNEEQRSISISNTTSISWQHWKESMRELIAENVQIGQAFGRSDCIEIMGKMLQNGINIYYKIMVEIFKTAREEDKTTIDHAKKTFSKLFLEIMTTQHTTDLFQRAQTEGFTKNIDRNKNYGMAFMIERLYTRQADKNAWTTLLNNLHGKNGRQTISKYFQTFISICLSNRAIMSAYFLLMYYQYLNDIMQILDWTQPNALHIITSVVLDSVFDMSNDLTRIPFTLESKIISEIKSNSIKKEEINTPSSSSSTPIPQQPPLTNNQGGCQIQ